MAGENDMQMSFWDHLESLRWALARVAGVLLVLVVVGFCFMPALFDSVVLAPTTSDFFLYRWLDAAGLSGFTGESFNVQIININVASQFMTHIKTSFWFALLFAFPYLVFEIWHFISPALFESERRSMSVAFVGGTLMFFTGCAVGYTLVFPFTFHFLTDYQLSASIANQISLDSYIGNFLMMVFAMGLVFELPLLSWLLSRLGVVSRSMLRGYRRHAVVVLLVLSAFITPSGDPFTLLVVFLPLYLLYELGIAVARENS